MWYSYPTVSDPCFLLLLSTYLALPNALLNDKDDDGMKDGLYGFFGLSADEDEAALVNCCGFDW